MREYIDLVSKLFEEAQVIQFRRPANVETPSRNSMAIFSSDSRFTLVITKATRNGGEYEREFVMKRYALTLAGLMHYFKNYNVSPMAPDEMRHWQSYDTSVIYDLHVFLNDHLALNLEQFNAINRMIKNGYTVPLVNQA